MYIHDIILLLSRSHENVKKYSISVGTIFHTTKIRWMSKADRDRL